MKKLNHPLLVLAFSLILPLHSLADAPTPMSDDEVCKNAHNIVIAEIISHQYETLKEGQSAKVMNYQFWTEYRIKKVLKGKDLKIGKSIRVTDEMVDYCYDYSTKATRKGDAITIKLGKGFKGVSKKPIKLVNLRKKHGQKVILFLTKHHTKKAAIFSHTCDIHSPHAYNEKFEKQICLNIKKSQPQKK